MTQIPHPTDSDLSKPILWTLEAAPTNPHPTPSIWSRIRARILGHR